MFVTHDWLAGPIPKLKPTYAAVSENYIAKEKRIGDPTRLILVDEADRLKIVCLEQMRAIFDAGGIGLVLIGMPGIEKQMARYAQFYSRIGFVHEFRPLNISEMRRLLTKGWTPPGVSLPALAQRLPRTQFAVFESLKCCKCRSKIYDAQTVSHPSFCYMHISYARVSTDDASLLGTQLLVISHGETRNA
jgi:AAA domain